MKPKRVKKLLLSEIRRIADNPRDYCTNPKTDFTRNRKLPLECLLTSIIGMGGGSLSNELLDIFNCSANVASTTAFVQQRSKVKPEAFETIFKEFSKIFLKNLMRI